MTANASRTHDIDVADVEYVHHGDKPLLARLFRPRGSGPFPLVVEAHGGAWCRGDRSNDTVINEPLAKSGVVVAALDFRMPPEAAYPASLADIKPQAASGLSLDSTGTGLPMNLGGIPCERGLTIAAGSSATWRCVNRTTS